MPEVLSEIMSLPGGPARVEWRRSSRARRVSLRVNPADGAVIVTLPMRTGRQAGLSLLMDHADWVAQRIAALPQAVALSDGAEVDLHGIPHRIRHTGQSRGGVRVEGSEILVSGGAEFLPRRVTDFLRNEARTRLASLALQKAAMADVHPKRVVIKDTRSRWGSCAPDRTLSFCWRLIMAPDFVQDYVVGHEVAHLRHMNHGPRFWALAETLTAHRDAADAWLKREGSRLLRVG